MLNFLSLLIKAHFYLSSFISFAFQVARCTKIINADSDDPKYIINVKQFAKFVVDLGDQVAPTDIEEGMRVGVDRNKYQIHIPLPPKIDPTVTMMQVGHSIRSYHCHHNLQNWHCIPHNSSIINRHYYYSCLSHYYHTDLLQFSSSSRANCDLKQDFYTFEFLCGYT